MLPTPNSTFTWFWVTSHLVTYEIKPGEFFKWQGAYGAFTIYESDVPAKMT